MDVRGDDTLFEVVDDGVATLSTVVEVFDDGVVTLSACEHASPRV
jgi:hypothetical protein